MDRGRCEDRVELPIIVGGGAASQRHVGGPTVEPAAHSQPRPVRRSGSKVLLAAVAVVLGVVASIVALIDPDDPVSTTPATSAPVLSPIAAPEDAELQVASSSGVPLPSSDAAVGTIEWTRFDGGAELPARVVVDVDGRLAGVDDALGLLRPIDRASRWLPVDTIERAVAGDLWRQDRVGGSPGLEIVTPLGGRTVGLNRLIEPLASGFVASIEPVTGPADGFPIELGDSVFLLASTRVGLPWETFAKRGPGGAYRVELADGERSLRFARGRFNEMAVEQFRLVAGTGPTHHVHDARGDVVWSFDAVGRSALEAVAGRLETSWLRWNGSRFVAMERPWPDRYDVDMVGVGGGVLARAADPSHRDVAMWFSADGYAWTPVDLPVERTVRTPVVLGRDDAGAIVTVFAEGGVQSWVTTTGATFERLPDVPGVADRRRGDFGWVTVDPHDAPTLRVSADGSTWEELDIGPLLDLDGSRWDVTITAAPDRDRIVVAADRPGGRTVLVGEVLPEGTG